MPVPTVLIAQTGSVRTLTLNRPASLNSFTGEMHERLRGELDAAAGDAGITCTGQSCARWESAGRSRSP